MKEAHEKRADPTDRHPSGETINETQSNEASSSCCPGDSRAADKDEEEPAQENLKESDQGLKKPTTTIGDKLMRTAVVLFIASLLTVLAITANAATIQNNDKNAYRLRVVENGQEKRIDLQPSPEAIDVCSSKCELYIDDDPDPYDIVAADAFVIEGGQVYDVNEPAPGTSTPNQ